MSKRDQDQQINERKQQLLKIIEDWMKEEVAKVNESRAQLPKEGGDTIE